MRCQWQSFLGLLPPRIREPVDRIGNLDLQELRLRIGQAIELVRTGGQTCLPLRATADDFTYIVNMATQYSPWASDSQSKGFLTAPGGHRIGLCGTTVTEKGRVCGFREIHSLCIRVARDIPGIGESAVKIAGSFLIIGRPGTGKTTLLRDIIRQISEQDILQIVVIDERQEIFPVSAGCFDFSPGRHTDVLSGCPKKDGIDFALRCMGPDIIAVDEITSIEDCDSMLQAGWCGVRLIATAHAGSMKELYTRPVYKPILDCRLFERVIVLEQDKSWHLEEVCSRC